jgi:hypothetical protein
MRVAGCLRHQAEIEVMPSLGLIPVHHADGLDELRGEDSKADIEAEAILGPATR